MCRPPNPSHLEVEDEWRLSEVGPDRLAFAALAKGVQGGGQLAASNLHADGERAARLDLAA